MPAGVGQVGAGVSLFSQQLRDESRVQPGCEGVMLPAEVHDELPIDGGAAEEQQKVGGGGSIQIGPQSESGIQQGDDFRVPLPPQHLAPLADGDGVRFVPRCVDDLV